jgi:hypothetical protein
MIIDQVDLASDYLNSFYDLTFVPTCYFDGGQQVLVGGYSSQAYYTSRINTCAQREVADLDLSIETTWLGEASLEITVNLTCNQFTNTPPDDPIEPEGIDEGFIETEYLFTTSAIDPDGDQLYYMWDWGNGEMSDWLGPYNSGETVDARMNSTMKVNGHPSPVSRLQFRETPTATATVMWPMQCT